MLDFTSALYLGMRHESRSLRPWVQLSTGRPAALAEPSGSQTVAQALARLQSCERSTLAPSTLHLFWDLFGMLARRKVIIYLDAGAYPIARWGVERARARGVLVRSFPHYNAGELRCQIKHDAPGGARPIVIANGFCPACGRPAPVSAYLESVRACGGYLILDDTQALGILGHAPQPEAPYGRGGGGSLRFNNIGGPDVLVISSLAKGFGVPLAVLAGSSTVIRRFEEKSEVRVHCSPPSAAIVNAAERALALNHKCGDALRLRLARLIRRFRNRLAEADLSAAGELFPVQTLAPVLCLDATELHNRLLEAGIRTVLHRSRVGDGTRISFIITALHNSGDIDRATCALVHVAKIQN